MDILSTLQALNACYGPSGDEKAVAEAIRAFACEFSDEQWYDTLGNLIVHKKGEGAKILFAAHMDSIGLIATHIEDSGLIRVGRMGGIDARTVLHTPVRFANGKRGLVAADESADLSKVAIEDLFIDIGTKNREETEKFVKIGDTAVYDTATYEAGERLVSPYMDNRISCVILLGVLEQLKDSKNDLYFVFTVQEEVGLRGAKTAAYGIAPDYALAVDVTMSDDLPGSKHHGSSVLGKGAAIKVMDSSVICHPCVVKKLTDLAVENNIAHQADVIRGGGTDAGAIHVSRAGVYTGGVSIPCRYIHSATEMVQTSDVESTISLIKAFAETDFSAGD